ncbi:hypothetical protein L6R53_13970 [Myxococcota bacterium]|nr:hypothetical protein [Myxococcota bacterium]
MTPCRPACVVSPELDPILLPAIERAALALAHGDPVLADDLAQEARLGAWQAAQDWWPEGGVPLRPWVMTAARQEMYRLLRVELRQVPDPLPELWELGDQGELATEMERAIELRQRLAVMPRRERAQVEQLLELGATPRAAGHRAGRAKERLRRALRRASRAA